MVAISKLIVIDSSTIMEETHHRWRFRTLPLSLRTTEYRDRVEPTTRIIPPKIEDFLCRILSWFLRPSYLTVWFRYLLGYSYQTENYLLRPVRHETPLYIGGPGHPHTVYYSDYDKSDEDEPSEAQKSKINPLIRKPFDAFLMGEKEIKFNPLKDIDDSIPILRVFVKPLDSLDLISKTFDMTITNPLFDFDYEFTLNSDNPIFDIKNKESDESKTETIIDEVWYEDVEVAANDWYEVAEVAANYWYEVAGGRSTGQWESATCRREPIDLGLKYKARMKKGEASWIGDMAKSMVEREMRRLRTQEVLDFKDKFREKRGKNVCKRLGIKRPSVERSLWFEIQLKYYKWDKDEDVIRNFMYVEDDKDLSFLPKDPSLDFGTGSPSVSINIDLPAVKAEPTNVGNSKQLAENIADSGGSSIRQEKLAGSSSRATRQNKSFKADSPFLTISDDEEAVNVLCQKITSLSGEAKEHKASVDMMLLDSKKWADYQESLTSLESTVAFLEAEKAKLQAIEVLLRQEVKTVKHDREEVVSKVVPYISLQEKRDYEKTTTAGKNQIERCPHTKTKHCPQCF
nr:hypothetical protein [Tanacetum cinerariifolium]